MLWCVLVGDGIDDPEKAIAALLEHGVLQPIAGGWIIGETETGENRRRAQHRQRQARYRAKSRVTRGDAAMVTRGDASDGPELSDSAGENHSLSRTEGAGERVSESPKVTRSDARIGDAGDARDGDARDAVQRLELELDAREVDDTGEVISLGREDDQPGSPWRLPERTDEETELGRQRIRELKEQLRTMRQQP